MTFRSVGSDLALLPAPLLCHGLAVTLLGVALTMVSIQPAFAQLTRFLDPARLPADNLPAPPLRNDIGNSTMSITTSSEEAQRWFDQGLNLLHCFWDFEAYRAFREAARSDPDAPMAHWGLYMALGYNPAEQSEARKEALKRARSLAPSATLRERLFIEAITSLDRFRGRAAQNAYVAAMEHLVETFPDDLESSLVLAKFLVTDAGGAYSHPSRPAVRSSFERAREILSPLLRSHPDNAAVHHYWIHAHEATRPQAALESARRLPEIAPGSGHTLHMPGHIYFRTGDYENAYAAFQKALRFDREYMAENGIAAVDHWSYTHNLDYLVANCAEDGRYAEGLRYATELQGQPVDLQRSQATGLGYLVYGARTAPAKLHFRYAQWDRAAAALTEGLRQWRFASQISADYVGGLLAYARAMAAAESGDLESAAVQFQRLAQLSVGLSKQSAELSSDWYFEAAKRVLQIAVFETGGSLMSMQGQHDQAIAQLERGLQLQGTLGYGEPPHYTRPMAESLGRAHLRRGDWTRARQAFESVLDERPESGHAWIGIAASWVGAGDIDEARKAYEYLLRVWRHADSDLAPIQQARAWLESHP